MDMLEAIETGDAAAARILLADGFEVRRRGQALWVPVHVAWW